MNDTSSFVLSHASESDDPAERNFAPTAVLHERNPSDTTLELNAIPMESIMVGDEGISRAKVSPSDPDYEFRSSSLRG